VWLGDIPVATLRPSGSTVAINYVHTDQLNTPREVTRPSDNAQLWTWFSDPFGTDAANSNPASVGAFPDNLRFPGQVFDGQAGLHANGYRDCYDPAIGRYCEPDPIGLMGGSYSTYAYVNGNPISYIDPFGLWGFGGIGSASGEVGLSWFGAGANASAGGGLFWGGAQGANLGGFASAGGFFGGPGYGPSYPAQKPSNCDEPNTAFGAFGGIGAGAFLTNANSAKDLAGPFTNYNYNIGFGPLQFSLQIGVSGSTWIGSLTLGPGVGASGSSFQTNTWSTR
jgi:RHS repeat-associated protein